MFRFITLVALVSAAFAGTVPNNDFDGRIVNGVDTSIEAHPYQVSLQRLSGFHFCGGSIIDATTIVTAAHCLQKTSPSQIQVRLGSTYFNRDGIVKRVRALRIHPGYNDRTNVNDVAVIKLIDSVAESSKIRYISLSESTPATGTPAVVTGWGVKCAVVCTKSPEILQEVVVDIIDRVACASKKYKYGSEIKATMVCAADTGKDACQGDSGGPLVVKNKLVGVVSWGRGCASANYPGVYSDVAQERSWIEETARSL